VQARIAIEPERACGGLALPQRDGQEPPPKPWVGFYALALAAAGLAYAARRIGARAAAVR
jgi:hypothetical protein